MPGLDTNDYQQIFSNVATVARQTGAMHNGLAFIVVLSVANSKRITKGAQSKNQPCRMQTQRKIDIYFARSNQN